MITLNREAMRIGLARISMAGFVRYTYPNYLMGWCHEEICERLDKFLADVQARRSPRLILCLPPRAGKSELASRRFPAYAFGRNPNIGIITASYSADLASRMNRDVQRVMDDERYRSVFPETVLPGKGIKTNVAYTRTTDMFEIVNRTGSYRSAGVGG